MTLLFGLFRQAAIVIITRIKAPGSAVQNSRGRCRMLVSRTLSVGYHCAVYHLRCWAIPLGQCSIRQTRWIIGEAGVLSGFTLTAGAAGSLMEQDRTVHDVYS